MIPKRIGRVVSSFAAIAILLGCGGADPEERVRARLGEANRAAEERDVARLLGFLADGYADSHGNDKASLGALLRYRFGESGSIHVLHKVRRIEIDDRGSAHVVALVALADTPIEISRLAETDGDILHVEIELSEDDSEGWQVVRADWRRAEPIDFF